jgi:Iron-containing alcohol dehydrogenase/Catechol dioxygenase N terminus
MIANSFSEKDSFRVVADSLSDTPDERLKSVMTNLVEHLHAFVKDIEPTHADWQQGIDFLTAVGHMCNTTRQEFVLLSDILGVSMLVDAINNHRSETATDTTVLGPFHDPELTLTLPVTASITSGFNAVAHAAEALHAPDGSPITALIAAESVRVIASALPRLVTDPRDIDARSDALDGAWLAGSALGSTTMSLHHKLCHILGGTFDLPHAETHTAVLPHVLAVNLPATPQARAALEAALSAADPATVIFHLAQDLGAEMSLGNLGMPAKGVRTVVDQALTEPYANPMSVTEADLLQILGNALVGATPLARSP